MTRFWALLLAASVGLLSIPPGASSSSDSLLADYSDLQEWAFSSQPIALPDGGIHWQTDVAEWHLDSGRVWLQRPTASGEITGLVFAGEGRFQMTIPDPFELRQLRRFTGDTELEDLQATFDALVLRGIQLAPVAALQPEISGSSYSGNSLAKQRHQHWLALRGFDADARVIAALGSSDDTYFRADMKTQDHGWLTFDYDGRRPEEIVVEWFNPAFSILESWLSIDRQIDRRPTGRPSSNPAPRIDIQHAAISVDLTHFASESQRGMARVRPIDARIDARVDFQPLIEGDRVVQLYLHPWAKVESVRDRAANDLSYLRDHLGKRSSAIDRKEFDDSLLVIMNQPLAKGEVYSIDLTYELELSGYAPGSSWYPTARNSSTGVYDRHTADLTVLHRANFAAKSLAAPTSQETHEQGHTVVWQMDEPLKVLSFVFAKKFHEEPFETAGSTAVTAFSSLGGFISRHRVEELGADTARIVDFFGELLGYPPGAQDLTVSLIPATHGQAFDGLIHIGDFSTASDRVSEREMFRAHEIAHLWWGHLVGWHGYRDQWLSEGFAEYSAMMYVEARVEKGERFFQEMLETFTHELTGSIKSDFSQFSRPGFSLLNKRAAGRVGPPGHGRRCLVGEAPTAYLSQTYKKGALTLHSLRMILRAKTGSDELFHQILRTFADTFTDEYATTQDFEKIVEDATLEDWSWFFDAWIYRASIPTYEWDYEISQTPTGNILNLEVEQSQVEEGFSMAIPVQIEFDDGTETTVLAFMDQPAKSFQFPLGSSPKHVTFNANRAVLARVKEK